MLGTLLHLEQVQAQLQLAVYHGDVDIAPRLLLNNVEKTVIYSISMNIEVALTT